MKACPHQLYFSDPEAVSIFYTPRLWWVARLLHVSVLQVSHRFFHIGHLSSGSVQNLSVYSPNSDCGRGVVSDSAAMEGWSGELTGLPRENEGDR